MVGVVPFKRLCHHFVGLLRAPQGTAGHPRTLPDEYHFEHFRSKKEVEISFVPPKTSAAETGQMSSVETEQMSAVDAG